MMKHRKEDPSTVSNKLWGSEVKVLCSEELFSGNREVVIQHGGSFYRLMITKAGKLILNK